MEKTGLSLICPVYYDENNIGPLVARSMDVLKPVCGELEILIVDDGSPDGSGRMADELSVLYKEVTALHHEQNLGHGAALKTGIRASRMPALALMDGDGQYDPADLPPMLELLDEYHLVQGRRPVYPNGRLRLAISRIYNMSARTLFNVPFTDLGCSLKVFKRETVGNDLPEGDGIFMQGELVLRAHFRGLKIREMDVSCFPRESGRSSSVTLKNTALLLRDMLRLRGKLGRAGERQP